MVFPRLPKGINIEFGNAKTAGPLQPLINTQSRTILKKINARASIGVYTVNVDLLTCLFLLRKCGLPDSHHDEKYNKRPYNLYTHNNLKYIKMSRVHGPCLNSGF